MTGNPADLTLSAAAALLRAGRVSAGELVEACLDRIERQQPLLNTFLTVDRDGARAAAAASDRRRARGETRGPLDGIPVAHKDLFDRAGRVTTAGSILLKNRIPGRTATVLKRLDAAGAIEIGTLGASEFAAGATGHNRHYGDCRNPWDRARIPGGSSGASAAAVAARQVFASLGTDTGGSVRMPAHFCGTVGLRPTQGRVSRHGIFPRSWSMDSAGPLARTAEDAALVLRAIAGPDSGDPTAEDVPVPDYSAALGEPVAGLRIGVPARYFFDEVDSGIRALLEAAQEVFAGLGVAVAPVEAPDPSLLFRLALIVLKAEAAAVHEDWIRNRPGDYDHGIREGMEDGLSVSAVDYLRALRERGPALERWLAGPLSQADALLTPVLDDPTPTLAESAVTGSDGAARVMARFGRCTRPFSFLGLPAMSIPCGFQPDGMPAGFQLIGRPFAERTLLRLGHAYRKVTDWHEHAPAIAPGDPEPNGRTRFR
ncbi:MAG: amidase [Rhodospirillaceae bacterium]|nr:amidase [Rhodospirillaceae bacterium]